MTSNGMKSLLFFCKGQVHVPIGITACLLMTALHAHMPALMVAYPLPFVLLYRGAQLARVEDAVTQTSHCMQLGCS